MAELTKQGRDRLPAEKFAEPTKRASSIEEKSHAANAKARSTQAMKVRRMSKSETAKIGKKADAVLKKA